MLLLPFGKTVSSDPGCEIWASNFLCACKCSVWEKKESDIKSKCSTASEMVPLANLIDQSHHMNIHDNSGLVSCQITADHDAASSVALMKGFSVSLDIAIRQH